MKHLILAAILAFAGSATASELDNESSVTNQSMNGTVVIRVDTRNNQAAVLASEQVVTNEAQAQNLVQNGSFSEVPAQNLRSELDSDGGASSWYFYRGYNYGYYGYVNWYGNWYYPRYYYNYGYYNYYYYSNYWW